MSEIVNKACGKLITFDKWFTIATTKVKYAVLVASVSNNLKDFLINLPVFHNPVMFIYLKLTPPLFKVKNIRKNSLNLPYISKREKIHDLVRGPFKRLSNMISTTMSIELIQYRNEVINFELLKISW
jgi:hypothetical protein